MSEVAIDGTKQMLWLISLQKGFFHPLFCWMMMMIKTSTSMEVRLVEIGFRFDIMSNDRNILL
jgi:hypothetical protein